MDKPDPEKTTILIIEDDREIQQVIAEYLTHRGFKTVSALDGDSGLERLMFL